mmetsp:Transcript_77796/g.251794  ORF Transcript_77796/g.251794 Transcript_77796/m.251794 type:complete len:215 (-) Transcript_77796:333-977(-)
MTAGTKPPEMRSANSCTGAFWDCASSTSWMICAMTEPLPTAWSLTSSVPCWFTVAPMTLSPGSLATGRDSPVRADSSTEDWPETTTPSAGTLAPGTTFTRSPWTSSRASTSRSRAAPSAPSSSRSSAVRACSESSAVMASPVLPLARHSSHLPRSTKVMSSAEVSKFSSQAAASRRASLFTSTTQEEAYAALVPSAMSAAMPSFRCRRPAKASR